MLLLESATGAAVKDSVIFDVAIAGSVVVFDGGIPFDNPSSFVASACETVKFFETWFADVDEFGDAFAGFGVTFVICNLQCNNMIMDRSTTTLVFIHLKTLKCIGYISGVQ